MSCIVRRISTSHSYSTRGAVAELEFAGSPCGFAVTSRVDADGVTLFAHGEIDMATAATLEDSLRDAEAASPRRIVLNLAGLDFIDSTGVHALVSAQRRANFSAHQLVLTDVPEHAHRLFALTGIDSLLTIR